MGGMLNKERGGKKERKKEEMGLANMVNVCVVFSKPSCRMLCRFVELRLRGRGLWGG